MADLIQVRLPADPLLLEEINLPDESVRTLAGTVVMVEIFQEEEAGTRRVEPDDYPLLIDREGNYWNDYRPLRAHFIGPDGGLWHLPRRWLPGQPANVEPPVPCESAVSREIAFTESFQLPNPWDMLDINIPPERIGGVPAVTKVEVRISPPNTVRVFWRDRRESVWRLPHDWRRRRIQLPSEQVLAGQGVPAEIAASCAHRILSVNYHPGSLCCLREHYRFRDDAGRKWPVRITDCLLLGYGSTTESRA
jgi:hypothetical protein